MEIVSRSIHVMYLIIVIDDDKRPNLSSSSVDVNATENEDQHVMINLSNGRESHHPIEEPLPEARPDECDLIALGNGTASRDVEKYISDLITSGWFSPLNVQYTIISEQGSSVYSCSPLAKKEFPSLDPKLISAVSLARRVQDPLSEYIKVDPKHLGVDTESVTHVRARVSMCLCLQLFSDSALVEGEDENCAKDVCVSPMVGNLKREKKEAYKQMRAVKSETESKKSLLLALHQKPIESRLLPCSGLNAWSKEKVWEDSCLQEENWHSPLLKPEASALLFPLVGTTPLRQVTGLKTPTLQAALPYITLVVHFGGEVTKAPTKKRGKQGWEEGYGERTILELARSALA
uniref:Tex protein YqgF-like domain-containing protein n=1 Tax=Timema bartmani TaxID=61472 RepID=A0A7R9EXN2_9NEOP|nr:unnamed protein product [Timema bartmani]